MNALERFATFKKLPVEELRRYGFSQNGRGIKIDYGPNARARVRHKAETAHPTTWENGDTRPMRVFRYHAEHLTGAKRDARFIVEGESCAATLWHHGRAAVGIPGATLANLIQHEDVESVAEAIIVREPGDAGMRFVQLVANRLRQLGFVGDIYEISLAPAEDVSALHISVDGDKDKFASLLDGALGKRTAVVNESNGNGTNGKNDPQTKAAPRANLIDLRNVRFERVRWFEQNMVPRAEFTLVNGDGGIGKTTFVLDFIARASANHSMPSGLRHEKPLRCLIIAEEDRHGLLRARLDVAGANFENIRLLESVGDDREFAVFPTHIETLRRTIEEGGFNFVMIDAYLNHFADEVNSSKPQDMRRVCRPLSTVAHDTGATIVAIRHFGKAVALASTLGSIEARNVSRSELAVAPHPDDDAHPGLFVVAISKTNLAQDHSATMAYRLTSVAVTDDDGDATTIARVEWEACPPKITANELTNRPEESEKSKIDAAADWLSDYLGTSEHRASDVCEAGKKAAHSQPTLYRARKKAGVTTEKRGYPAKAYWFIKEPLVSQVSSIGEPDAADKPANPDESRHEVVNETEETAEALFAYANERIKLREPAAEPNQEKLL